MKTAFTLEPGGVVYRRDKTYVCPPGRVGVACEACAWFTFAPTSDTAAELARTTHLLAVHHDDLIAGRATLFLDGYFAADGRFVLGAA